MSLIIPVRPSLAYATLQVTLEGVNYTLQFLWNDKEQAWYMDVLDDTGTTILVGGIKLVVDSFLEKYRSGRQPPGTFVAFDTAGTGVDPGFDDLGVRVQLRYFTAAELGL